MNILHINTSADQGGAANAMRRLHNGLIANGWHSRILAGSKTIRDDGNIFLTREAVRYFPGIIEKPIQYVFKMLDTHTGLFYWFYPYTFSLARTEIFKWADIVNFHNLHGHYFNLLAIPLLARNKPSILTLHDMWPLTGHCGYSYDCQRWISGCYKCPILRDPILRFEYPGATTFDMTKIVWKIKKNIYKKSYLNIVAPSGWMRSIAESSILSQNSSIEHIPYGVDLEIFYPMDKLQAKYAIGIKKDMNVLMFAAHDTKEYRKGLPYLLMAIKAIQDNFNICLLLLGHGDITGIDISKVRIKKMGYLQSEDLLRLCYNAADLLILPTLADNQPLVLIEAMACGTPAVAFDIGGVSEIVEHMENGYMARYRDPEDLANGIKIFLRDRNLLVKMSRQCREIAEQKYSLNLQCKRYINFYEKVLNEWKKTKNAR